MEVREPDLKQVPLDPNTCTVMDGHQHNPTGIEELADSIATLGQLHPSLIIEYADGRRLIAAGRRRWMACKLRGLPLIANVWTCQDENINLELFAKAIRVAENIERTDPSAMDIAIQLQTIRNERQLKNAAELGKYMGMSEGRIKQYLSVFSASDYLREKATNHSFPLHILLELRKCEKRLGESVTKKLINSYIKGDITAAEMAKRRGKPTRKKRTETTPEVVDARLRKSGAAMLKAFGKAPPISREYIGELIESLKGLLAEEEKAA